MLPVDVKVKVGPNIAVGDAQAPKKQKINNPNIIRATEVWTNMKSLENHFKTENFYYFNSIMEKYPPKNIIINTYETKKISHPLD